MKEHLKIALPTASSDAEPTRAFLQDRICLWALWIFILSGGVYVANLVLLPLLAGPSRSIAGMVLHPSTMLHLAVTLMYGVVSLTLRSRRLPITALRVLDFVALVGGCSLFAVMGLQVAQLRVDLGQNGVLGVYAGLLASVNVVSARAITVPSTARRTLVVTFAAMLPHPIAAAAVAGGEAAAWVHVAIWCALSVAVTTVGSHVIFGLRAEASRVRKLGQYTLEERIGAGGMGVVYRASHAMLRRPTAIKLLPPERAGEASLVRFEREVQITAQLSHPNTVSIYDYGRTPEGVFYYAMEYLDGINLDDLVRHYGPQRPGRVISILSQVCGALSEAHGRGLIHRDIKPANIILTERGGEPDVAKVVDFGLVKPFSSDASGATLTSSNVVTGTPLYMSPESMTSPEIGNPRSDLYALGAVGYFLVTGQPVFDGNSVIEIIGHHLHTEPVPPSMRGAPATPPDLEAVILQCLRKSPDERPADARALRHDLKRCAAAQSWTADDAAAWWSAFRSGPSPVVHIDADPELSSGLTVTIDVADRLGQSMTRA